MDTEKKYRKVKFEIYTAEGYQGYWTYGQRHMKFSEADIPELFEKRPNKDQETEPPVYRWMIDKLEIIIGLFYDGPPEDCD